MKFIKRVALIMTSILIAISVVSSTTEIYGATDDGLLATADVIDTFAGDSYNENLFIDDEIQYDINADDKSVQLLSDDCVLNEETVSVNNDKLEEKDENEVTIDDFTYVIDDDNLTATVTGWSGSGKAVIPRIIVLPSNSSHYSSVGPNRTVNAIGEKAFENNAGLTEIAFPDTVVYINKNAFTGCSALDAIELPASMNKIDNEAFSDCIKLSSVKLPDKLKDMGFSVFKGCTSLKSITIPKDMDLNLNLDNLNYSSVGPFSDAENLTEISFEKDIKKIPNGLFYKCKSIKTI